MTDNPTHLEHRGGCHISVTPVQESILRTEMETRADDSPETPIVQRWHSILARAGALPSVRVSGTASMQI